MSADPGASEAPSARTQSAAARGRVTAIRGGIVDVAFEGAVPRIGELLHADGVAMEVSALLDERTVRAMALAPVRGLGLGTPVTATAGRSRFPSATRCWGGC